MPSSDAISSMPCGPDESKKGAGESMLGSSDDDDCPASRAGIMAERKHVVVSECRSACELSPGLGGQVRVVFTAESLEGQSDERAVYRAFETAFVSGCEGEEKERDGLKEPGGITQKATGDQGGHGVAHR
jgi:hypothetical protein